MTHLKGEISPAIAKDKLPIEDPSSPLVPWLQLMVGSENHVDYVRIFMGTPDVMPNKLRALAATFEALAVQQEERWAETMRQRNVQTIASGG